MLAIGWWLVAIGVVAPATTVQTTLAWQPQIAKTTFSLEFTHNRNNNKVALWLQPDQPASPTQLGLDGVAQLTLQQSILVAGAATIGVAEGLILATGNQQGWHSLTTDEPLVIRRAPHTNTPHGFYLLTQLPHSTKLLLAAKHTVTDNWQSGVAMRATSQHLHQLGGLLWLTPMTRAKTPLWQFGVFGRYYLPQASSQFELALSSRWQSRLRLRQRLNLSSTMMLRLLAEARHDNSFQQQPLGLTSQVEALFKYPHIYSHFFWLTTTQLMRLRELVQLPVASWLAVQLSVDLQERKMNAPLITSSPYIVTYRAGLRTRQRLQTQGMVLLGWQKTLNATDDRFYLQAIETLMQLRSLVLPYSHVYLGFSGRLTTQTPRWLLGKAFVAWSIALSQQTEVKLQSQISRRDSALPWQSKLQLLWRMVL